MPVQNIECQIAQAQITRLLAGDSFSNEVLAELETHIGECAECRAHVSNRRSALEAMVAEADPQPATPRRSGAPQINLLTAQFKPGVPEPEPEATISKPRPAQPKPENLVPAPVRQAVVETRREAPSNVQNFWKPLGYSCALAAVLFAMSYIMKNPTAIFGDKAVETLASPTSSTTTASKTSKTPSAKPADPAPKASTTPPEATKSAPAKDATSAAASAGAASTTEATKPASTKDAAPASEEPKPSIFLHENALDTQPTERVASIGAPRIRHRARIHRRTATPHIRPEPRRARSTLHIYDADGRQIR